MSTTEIDPASFKVPDGLKPLLDAYLKEVLRYQPQDIVSFSRDYFSALASGQIDVFLHAQRARMVAIAGPGTDGYKTLQDYSIGSGGPRVVARPPAPEEEDPTEREIRDLSAHYPLPLPSGAAAAADGEEDLPHMAVDTPGSKGLGGYSSFGAAGSPAFVVGRGGVHGSAAAADDEQDAELLEMQEQLKNIEEEERRKSVVGV